MFALAFTIVIQAQVEKSLPALPDLAVGLAQEIMGGQVTGMIDKDCPEGGHGLLVLAHFLLKPAEIKAEFRIARRSPHGPLKHGLGLLVLTILEVDPAQSAQDERVQRMGVERPAQMNDGLIALIGAGQDQTVLKIADGILGIRFVGFAVAVHHDGGIAVLGQKSRVHARERHRVHRLGRAVFAVVGFDAVAHVDDTLFHRRVGHDPGGYFIGPEPLFAAQDFKHLDHTGPVVTGPVHAVQAELIGLGLVPAAIGQHDGLGAGHGAHHHGLPGLGGPGEGGGKSGDHTGISRFLEILRPFDFFRNMPAFDMPDFMGQQSGQLLLAIHGRQQPAVDEDMSGRGGKRIEHILFDDIEMVFKRLRRHFGQDTLADVVHVVDDDRVLDEFKKLAQDPHVFLGELLFLLDGQAVHRRYSRNGHKRRDYQGDGDHSWLGT